MGVEYKDYYKVLAVERTATQDEIRKAFRKLARQHHPDVAKNKKEAEEKFKEINEAHDVLSDPEKRRKYDALGANWKQGAEFRPPPGWDGMGGRAGRGARGGPASGESFEFGGTGFSDFFEQLFGRQARGAGGFAFEGEDLSARGRDIEGDIMVTLEEALRGSVRAVSLRRAVTCPQCGGTGETKRRMCTACGGSGQVMKSETHQVKIPAGVIDGQRLRVAGKGESGAGGAGAGDLFLNIRLAGHPDFRVEGANLFCDIELAPWEAVLGAHVAVPTLEGPVNIRIPAGTQNGQRLRVRGHGLGKEGTRGDLFVVGRLQIPAQVSAPERELWEKLAKESHFNPRG
ncbi:MAG: curved DNA-binding protein [Verrucomicrobiota bacterium]|jgi:curved DNA-binding protein